MDYKKFSGSIENIIILLKYPNVLTETVIGYR